MFVQLELEFQIESGSVETFDLGELFDHLNRELWSGKLPRFRCEWSDRMITTWGICYRHKKLIRISSIFKQRPFPELRALLCHEMIHIKYRGHGTRFKNELKRIGLQGDVQKQFPHLTDFTNALRRPLRYVYECPACQVKIQRRRRIRGFCAACHSTGVVSRFRLAKKPKKLVNYRDTKAL